MGRRKKEASNMGKALIKDRFRGKTVFRGGESFLHTTELNDGYEGRSLNLQSLTEQTSMNDFLMTAELAGRDFTAEKENVQLVTPQLNSGILSGEKLKKVKAIQDLYKGHLRIPRRPAWTESTPADKLRQDEHTSFLEWRRQLGRLQEEEHIVITPYEKNLEFWRQLWRVIERSDVVVQIVDARNPLLFWCPDLDKYVKEIDSEKQTLLLINKADLLTVNQRQAWAEYFASQGVHVIFWSAIEEAARLEKEKDASTDQSNNPNDNGDDDNTADDSDKEDERDDTVEAADRDVEKDDVCDNSDERDEMSNNDKADNKENVVSDNKDNEDETDKHSVSADDVLNETDNKDDEKDTKDNDSGDDEVCDGDGEDDSDGYETIEETTDDEAEEEDAADTVVESRSSGKPEEKRQTKSQEGSNIDTPKPVAVADCRVQTSDDLLSLFRRTVRVHYKEGVTTVGMVGYPNVGKSSTINAILQTKKVPVSATPGRTKHFQTLYVEKDLMLCDCPGLVFPSFVNSKAELVVNGILPIDQLQDSEPPVELVCNRVGRSAFEALYHMNLPPPEEWEDPDKAPSAYDLLQAYGALRGFMSHKGNPDRPRAARYILKDFVNGKLLFCHPPPSIEAAAFQKPPYGDLRVVRTVAKIITQKTATQKKTDALDQEFLTQKNMKPHAKGPKAVSGYVRTEALKQVGVSQGQDFSSEASSPHSSQSSLVGKPWKKHNNRNKKEKLRRVYKDLD